MKSKHLILIFLLLTLSACSNPIPESRLHYVGEWQSKGMSVLILEDGRVEYERVTGRSTVSINAPIKEFVEDDFVVGVWFLTTTFDVSKPPEEVDGKWQMVVDGVRLTKVEEY